MADNNNNDFIVNTQELLNHIQESYEMADGNIVNIFNDLKTAYKDIQGVEVSDNAKRLMDDEDSLRAFYADAIEKLKGGEPIAVYVDHTTNVSQSNTTTEPAPKKEKKPKEPSELGTFRNMLDQQIDINENFLGKYVNSQFATEDSMKQMGQQISFALNSDVFGKTGKKVDRIEADKMVASALKHFEGKMVNIEDNQSKSMISSSKSLYNGISEKFSGFFGSKFGSIVYDGMNVVTMGQLGVVQSLWHTAGKFLDITGEMSGVVSGMGAGVKKMNNAVQELYSGVSKQVDKVFGEEKEALVDPILDAGRATGNAFGIMKDKDTKQLDIAKESKNTLDDILHVQMDQLAEDEKQRLVDGRKTKSQGIVGFLKELFKKMVFGIGFIIGGLVGAILKPFDVLRKGVIALTEMLNIKKFTFVKNIITYISSFTTRISTFMKGLMGMGKGLTGVTKIMGFIRPALDMFKKIFKPILKIFAGAFMKGFAKLAWPLQILLSAIDFIKGFIGSSESSFLGKLKDGMKAAVIGFFGLPIKLLGWMVEKLLGFIGIDVKGVGDKIISFLSGAIDMMFDPLIAVMNVIIDFVKSTAGNIWGMIKSASSIIGNIIGGLINLLTGDFSGLKKNLDGIMSGVKEFLGSLGGIILGWIKLPFEMVTKGMKAQWEGIKGKFGGMLDPIISLFKTIGDFVMSVVDWVGNQMKKIPLVGDLFKTDIEKIKEANTKDEEEILKVTEKRSKLQEEILKLESGPQKEDNKWMPGDSSTAAKIAKLKAKQVEMDAEEAELRVGITERSKAMELAKDPNKETFVDEMIRSDEEQWDKMEKELEKRVPDKIENVMVDGRLIERKTYGPQHPQDVPEKMGVKPVETPIVKTDDEKSWGGLSKDEMDRLEYEDKLEDEYWDKKLKKLEKQDVPEKMGVKPVETPIVKTDDEKSWGPSEDEIRITQEARAVRLRTHKQKLIRNSEGIDGYGAGPGDKQLSFEEAEDRTMHLRKKKKQDFERRMADFYNKYPERSPNKPYTLPEGMTGDISIDDDLGEGPERTPVKQTLTPLQQEVRKNRLRNTYEREIQKYSDGSNDLGTPIGEKPPTFKEWKAKKDEVKKAQKRYADRLRRKKHAQYNPDDISSAVRMQRTKEYLALKEESKSSPPVNDVISSLGVSDEDDNKWEGKTSVPLGLREDAKKGVEDMNKLQKATGASLADMGVDKKYTDALQEPNVNGGDTSTKLLGSVDIGGLLGGITNGVAGSEGLSDDPGFMASNSDYISGYGEQLKFIMGDNTNTMSASTLPKNEAMKGVLGRPLQKKGSIVSSMENDINSANAANKTKQMEELMRMSEMLNEGNKDQRENSERPIVVNTGGSEHPVVDPPTDIESMSVLWLNKSWGLG